MAVQVDLSQAAALIAEVHERVRRAYGNAIGRHRSEVVTPALLLDLPAARRNITKMGERMGEMSAELRPHIKVHKSPELAQMQVEAGAIGISTATVWEAIVMARSGLDGIFVVNTVAGREKLAALARLARDVDVMVAVDEVGNATNIAAAAREVGSTVGILIEVDTGMDRAGVDSTHEALALAENIVDLNGVRFAGVSGYEGHCSLTPERELRHKREQKAMAFLVETAEALHAHGIPCPIVSAGGTATWDWTASYPGVTESQAGSYVVMDHFHGAMVGDFEHSVFVASTVISKPEGRLIVDAGSKSMGAPNLATIVGQDLPNFRFDEEHGIFDATDGTELRVGDVVQLVPGYAPATINWYDAYHVLEDDHVVDIWPVIPRGPGHGGLLG